MNREPLFACDGECECGHREEDLRVFEGKVLCDYCWEDRVWPEAPNFEQTFSDLPPFKSTHLTRNHPDDPWQPIETAPKDADSVILRNGNIVGTGRYRNYPSWESGGDWFFDGASLPSLATHWMPTPKPPKEGSEE